MNALFMRVLTVQIIVLGDKLNGCFSASCSLILSTFTVASIILLEIKEK